MTTNTIADSVSPSLSPAVSDGEFLGQIEWTEEADLALVQAAREGDRTSFWALLTRQVFGLGVRAHRKKVHERRYASAMSLWAASEALPLAEVWNELSKRWEAARESALSHRAQKKIKSTNDASSQTVGMAIKIPRKVASALTDWLESPSSQTPSAREVLILAEMLRLVGSSLPAKLGVPLWRCLLQAAGRSDFPQAGQEDQVHGPEPLGLVGEVAWVLGLFFADVRGSESLRERGRQVFAKLLEDHTDTDGTLRATEMQQAITWLPPVVRAVEWAYAAEEPLWGDADRERFQSLVNRVSGCLAGDGHLAFDQTNSGPALPLLLTAARLAGGSKKAWPLKFLLEVAEAGPEFLAGAGSGKTRSAKKLKASRRRPAETNTEALVQQSDWARMACLRSHAGLDADVLAVTHHQCLPQMDFSILGHLIIQGPWELEVARDGKQIALPQEWTCVCWHTDSDGDYLELQHTIDENLRIERQVFLSRTDHFLIMADCISGAGQSPVDYTARWPLAKGAKVSGNSFTRERVVSLGNLSMRTFPLALPDEIVHGTSGRWGLAENKEQPSLELRQSSIGGLYALVAFDWTPARRNSDADWRTLTITENGPKVKTDRASGHRLRIGNQQLLIYRSLAPTEELRTVLGHHTGHETIIARFDKQGDVKPLLIVE